MFLTKNTAKTRGWKRRLKLRIAVGQWQLCENYRPVVMEMAWANVKIRHFFGFTSLTERSIGAGPPVIIQLSVSYICSEHSKLIHIHQKTKSQQKLQVWTGPYICSSMKDCGEDLLVDISEILFNELAFYKLMQELDGCVYTVLRQ